MHWTLAKLKLQTCHLPPSGSSGSGGGVGTAPRAAQFACVLSGRATLASLQPLPDQRGPEQGAAAAGAAGAEAAEAAEAAGATGTGGGCVNLDVLRSLVFHGCPDGGAETGVGARCRRRRRRRRRRCRLDWKPLALPPSPSTQPDHR
jgi:hypothetical protein